MGSAEELAAAAAVAAAAAPDHLSGGNTLTGRASDPTPLPALARPVSAGGLLPLPEGAVGLDEMFDAWACEGGAAAAAGAGGHVASGHEAAMHGLVGGGHLKRARTVPALAAAAGVGAGAGSAMGDLLPSNELMGEMGWLDSLLAEEQQQQLQVAAAAAASVMGAAAGGQGSLLPLRVGSGPDHHGTAQYAAPEDLTRGQTYGLTPAADVSVPAAWVYRLFGCVGSLGLWLSGLVAGWRRRPQHWHE
jgi:hypothetical protein